MDADLHSSLDLDLDVVNDEWLGHGWAVDIWAVDAELLVPTLQWMIAVWQIGVHLNLFFL